MNFAKSFTLLLAVMTTLMAITSCSKEDNNNVNNNVNNSGQELFFSFQTPDWGATIPCEKIDFLPDAQKEGVAYVKATSASTNASFGFPFPADSSAIARSSNIKKYSIFDYSGFTPADGYGAGTDFEISLKLNKANVNDTRRLYSTAGFSDNNYNEVTSIQYTGSESNYANFLVKGNYKMNMIDAVDSNDHKQVTGSYCIKVRTHKK